MPEVMLPEHLLSNIEREAPWDLGIIEASKDERTFPEKGEIDEFIFDEVLFPH